MIESLLDLDKTKLICEDDMGNVEYKLRLDSKTSMGIEKLSSQMNWRLSQGQLSKGIYEAHYILGVDDHGNFGKLTEVELDATILVLHKAIKKCNATVTLIEKENRFESYVAHILLHKKFTQKVNEMNVAFVGPSDAGKSTCVSYLTSCYLDDGQGSNRQMIMRYEHEKSTGKTSSIKKVIVGVKDGTLNNFTSSIDPSWESIVNSSNTVINLIDLPGDKKYCKTTYHGLLSYKLDLILIVVDASKINDTNTCVEIEFYYSLAKLMNVPALLILNKIDLVDAIDMPLGGWYTDLNILHLSTVTEEGCDEFVEYLCKFNVKSKQINICKDEQLFTVVESYTIPDSGNVLYGSADVGLFEINDILYVTDGQKRMRAVIKSIRKKQIDSNILYEGETGCLQMEYLDDDLEINKHSIITTRTYPIYNKFCVRMPKHFTIPPMVGHRCVIFVGNMMSCIVVESVEMSDDVFKIIGTSVHTPILIPKLYYNDNVVCILRTINDEFYVCTLNKSDNDE
jgi:small GTP-binding protein